MAEISEIFGSGKISYDEFLIKAGEMGMELGDIGEMRARYEEEIRGIKCAGALERALDRAGVKNRELFMKVIDMGAVTVGEDGVRGITEQIDLLRESDPYLFEDARSASSSKVSTGLAHGGAAADPDRMSDREFYKRVKMM